MSLLKGDAWSQGTGTQVAPQGDGVLGEQEQVPVPMGLGCRGME